MEFYSRAITAAVCLLGGLAIGTFGLASLIGRYDRSDKARVSEDAERGGISRHELSQPTSNAIALRTLELTSARQRVVDLQQQLEDQTAALSNIRRELQSLVRQNEKLRSERNESLDWLLTLFSDEQLNPPDSSIAPELLESLENQANSESQQLQQLIAVENLQGELELARAELAEAQAARQLERVEAEEAREEIEQSAAEILTTVGEQVVTALGEALEHPDAEVRRLAARSLRAFGNRGQASIPALTMALADPDLRVREEAALALRAIQD